MLIPNSYNDYVTATGKTMRERTIFKAKQDFVKRAVENPSYCPEAKVNDVEANLLLLSTKSNYKAEAIMFPDENICRGDYVDSGKGLVWLCQDVSEICSWQKKGLLWLCNIDLKWQDFNKNIHSKLCVFDSGAYSTTITGDAKTTILDKKFKVYIPYDEETKTLFIDKRLAIDRRMDSLGNEVLETYKIISLNRVGQNYGHGNHLLEAIVESDTFSPELDNVEMMICDYKKINHPPIQDDTYQIQGRDTIRCGTARNYELVSIKGGEVPPIDWGVTPEVDSSVSKNILTIRVEKDSSLAGQILEICANIEDKQYTTKVEVIN